jgi:hypothetical protein
MPIDDALLADLMLVRAQILAGNHAWAAEFLGMIIRWSEEDQALVDRQWVKSNISEACACQ